MPIATPDSYPGIPGTTLYAGIDPGGGALRLITSLNVASTSGTTQTNLPVTFGHPFAQGDFDPSTESLYAKVDGADVPIQFDAVSTFADGSARLAVLSAQIPSIAGNGTKELEIYAGDSFVQPSGTFNTDGWDPVVVATIGGTPWTASPRAALLAAIASNTGVRLNGPVAKEIRVSVPFLNASQTPHTQLMARFDVRLYANGAIRTDMIIENGWLFAASPTNLTYSLVCTQGAGGSTILSVSSFTHYSRTRWHRVFWNGPQSQYRPQQNKAYFFDSTITVNYNRNQTINSSALNTIESNAGSSTSPMATAGLTIDMPQTGGRDEIAHIPKWTVMWLLSHDVRAWNAMIRNADASATAPIHYRDQSSDLPMSISTYPNLAVRYGSSSPSVPATPAGSPWNPDIAHQGSYCYIPYVVTGDFFYLEECTFWAAWNVAANDPSSRSGSNGYLPATEQLRGAAWGFRSLLECSYALPDNHPQKSYFVGLKNNQITFFNSNYTTTSDNTYVFPLGGMKGIYNNNQIPGYENDFMFTVMSWAIENGETGLISAYNNVGRYVVGRFLSATQSAGFCTAQAAHYWFNSRTGSTPYTTWSAYASANGAGGTCASTASTGDPAYSEWAEGYAAVSRGMLAAAANAGHPDAATAYTRWLTFTPNLAPDFANSPQYAIVPR